MKKFCLGYLPARRTGSFPAPEAIEFGKRVLGKIRELAPEITIKDINWLNEEGLPNNPADAMRTADYMLDSGADALFIPHCNFGCGEAISLVARKVGKPVLLWGPRDGMPLPNGDRLRDSQCGLFCSLQGSAAFRRQVQLHSEFRHG